MVPQEVIEAMCCPTVGDGGSDHTVYVVRGGGRLQRLNSNVKNMTWDPPEMTFQTVNMSRALNYLRYNTYSKNDISSIL